MAEYVIAREWNAHGPQDFLVAWDPVWVASFAARKVAMTFDNRTQAETWAGYLAREVPVLVGGGAIRYRVMEA